MIIKKTYSYQYIYVPRVPVGGMQEMSFKITKLKVNTHNNFIRICIIFLIWLNLQKRKLLFSRPQMPLQSNIYSLAISFMQKLLRYSPLKLCSFRPKNTNTSPSYKIGNRFTRIPWGYSSIFSLEKLSCVAGKNKICWDKIC